MSARPSVSVAATRDIVLLECDASVSAGWSAPRIRRVLPSAMHVTMIASALIRPRARCGTPFVVDGPLDGESVRPARAARTQAELLAS